MFKTILAALILACDEAKDSGKERGNADQGKDNAPLKSEPMQFAQVLPKVGDLDCDETREGLLVYSREDKSFFVCALGEFEADYFDGEQSNIGNGCARQELFPDIHTQPSSEA